MCVKYISKHITLQNIDQFSFSQANNVRLYLYNAYKKAMTTRHQILTQLELKEGQLEAVNSKLSELFDSLHKNEKKQVKLFTKILSSLIARGQPCVLMWW